MHIKMALIEGIGDEVTYAALLFSFILLILTSLYFKAISQAGISQRAIHIQEERQLSSNASSEHVSTSSTPVNTEQSCDVEHSGPGLSEPSVSSRNEDTSGTTVADEGTEILSNENSEQRSSNEQSDSDATNTEAKSTSSKDLPSTKQEPTYPDGNSSENVVTETNQIEEVLNSGTLSLQNGTSTNVITIRLKFLNDTERIVTTEATETIENFKRLHFLEEVSSNKIIKLIYNGQLLRTGTLRSWGICDGTVVHVHVSQAQIEASPPVNSSADLDLSAFFWPLFTLILGICWVFYIRYPEFFSITSIILLITLSASFIAVYVHAQMHVQ